MVRRIVLLTVLTVALTSCTGRNKLLVLEEKVESQSTQLSEYRIKNELLATSFEEQKKNYGRLLSDYRELEIKLQNIHNRELRQASASDNDFQDISGLYKLTPENINFHPSGFRVFSLGEGYRIESLELESGLYMGMGWNMAESFGYVTSNTDNFYQFYMETPFIQSNHGPGIVIFELFASITNLQGIAFYQGNRASAIDVVYVKVADDPFTKDEELTN